MRGKLTVGTHWFSSMPSLRPARQTITLMVVLLFLSCMAACDSDGAHEDAHDAVDIIEDMDVDEASADVPEDGLLPILAHVSYTLHFQGRETSVVFDGAVGEDFQGSCAIGDSADPDYPKLLSFMLENPPNMLDLQQLRTREVPQDEFLQCVSFNIEMDQVRPLEVLTCGIPEVSPSFICEFKISVYDQDENRVEGSFRCPRFYTNAFDPSGPVEMRVEDGVFSFANCI